ncbi:MAG: hypothetical protein JWR52_1112 [Marmoricola sp.]|nr:hypothetical protein [Marmoricola sp.]
MNESHAAIQPLTLDEYVKAMLSTVSDREIAEGPDGMDA